MRLKELRKTRKLKQIDIAEVLSCSQGVYSRYENEEREPPLDIIDKLAKYYGVTVDYLLGRDTPTVTIPPSFSGPVIGSEFKQPTKMLPMTAIDMGHGEIKTTLDPIKVLEPSPTGTIGYAKSNTIAQIMAELESMSDEKLDDALIMLRLMKK